MIKSSVFCDNLLKEDNFYCNYYIKNIGQMDDNILYYTDFSSSRFYIRKSDFVFQFYENSKIKNIYLKFEFGNLENIIPLKKQNLKFNFIKGNKENKWIKNVPVFKEILIKDIYDGVDLIFDENFWYYNITKEKNSFDKIKISFETSEKLKFSDKSLKGTFGSTDIFIKYPEIKNKNDILEINKNLKKDQNILWGTYFGGIGYDKIHSLKMDLNGDILISGFTSFSSIPAPSGYDQTNNGLFDGYVAKISAEGNELLWGTFLGGEYHDYIFNLGIDYSGNIFVCGYTNSLNFPVINGLDDEYNGGDFDGFVSKLSSDGSNLLWSSYLGGSSYDYIFGMDIDFNGNVLLSGGTGSEDFPVKNGFDSNYNNGHSDGFITKISADGKNFLWGSFIGGQEWDQIESIKIDNSENIVLGGWTSSTDIPAINGYDSTYNGGLCDGYIAKISKMGTNILWSTYLGGNVFDYIFTLDLDSQGNVIVGGATEDLFFPNGYDLTFNGLEDNFVSKISADGKNLLWGSYLGGSLDEEIRVLKIDKEDNVFVGGWTISLDIPVPSGFDKSFNGGYWDAYLAKFSPDGKNLLFGTYIGGKDNESIFGIDFDSEGNIILAGWTLSSNLSFTNGFDISFNGNIDGFILKITDPSFIESSPEANFIWFPSNPKKEEEIQFIDKSKKYPDLWQWNFGDGNTSNIQNPKHKYLKEGEYDVSLNVSNSSGSNSISKKILIEKESEKKYSQWLPVSTHSSGAYGSEWRTDIGIINKENYLSNFDFYLYTDQGVLKLTDTIPSNGSSIYEDIVSQFMYSGSSAFQARSDNNFILTSRTYNKTQDGTYGQFLNGYYDYEGLSTGEGAYLSQLKENENFRTNIGLTNTGDNLANISIYFYDSPGNLLGSKTVYLEPKKFIQLLQPIKEFSENINSAYAKIQINSGNGILCYASVVDNKTNDGTTIPAKK